MPKFTLYKDIPNNSVFKVLKPDIVVNRKTGEKRVVENKGTYLKMGQSHSVDIVTRKDCIFHLETPCKCLPDWHVKDDTQ